MPYGLDRLDWLSRSPPVRVTLGKHRPRFDALADPAYRLLASYSMALYSLGPLLVQLDGACSSRCCGSARRRPNKPSKLLCAQQRSPRRAVVSIVYLNRFEVSILPHPVKRCARTRVVEQNLVCLGSFLTVTHITFPDLFQRVFRDD